jgi:hypothetical protein
VDPALRRVELPSDLAARVCSAWSARLDRLVPHSAYVEASCTQQAWPLSADAEFKPSQPRCQELHAMCVASARVLALGALVDVGAAMPVAPVARRAFAAFVTRP